MTFAKFEWNEFLLVSRGNVNLSASLLFLRLTV